jgi:hypothetical protein
MPYPAEMGDINAGEAKGTGTWEKGSEEGWSVAQSRSWAMRKAGLKRMTLDDGTMLNYSEGPANGKPPLLFIHGQGMTWEDYTKVLPALSSGTMCSPSCHGHEESDWSSRRLNA